MAFLAQFGNFFLYCLNVALVQRHFVLERLQAINNALVIFFVPGTDRFLFCQCFLGLIKILLLGCQFAFKNPFTISISGLLRIVVNLGKTFGCRCFCCSFVCWRWR